MCRAALVGLVLILVTIAYYPFAWSPPRMVDNQVTREADGSLRFAELNDARTLSTPTWVDGARESDTVRILLDVDPQSGQQQASMMMLASDYTHGDFSIQQDDSALVVWLKRPGSGLTGDPPFAIPGALQPQRWNRVELIVEPGRLTVRVDGVPRLAEPLPPDALESWGTGRLALGDEVQGGRPWAGRIRTAQVITPGHEVDYVVPGPLWIPRSYLYLPDHFEPFPPSSRGQWLRTLLDMLSFIPAGFLIVRSRRPPVRLAGAVLVSAALAVTLAAGKIFFADRHTSVGVVLLQVVGGVFGALLASWLARRAEPARERSPDRDGLAD